jgi:hypothetical protein
MVATNQSSIEWNELSGAERTLLTLFARREVSGRSTHKHDIYDDVGSGRTQALTQDGFWGVLSALSEKNLLQGGPHRFQVTDAGRRELFKHWVRLGAALDEHPTQSSEMVAACPSCGTRIAAITANNDWEITTDPCECILQEADLDPPAANLVAVLEAIEDPAIANHLHQALYLQLADSND